MVDRSVAGRLNSLFGLSFETVTALGAVITRIGPSRFCERGRAALGDRSRTGRLAGLTSKA